MKWHQCFEDWTWPTSCSSKDSYSSCLHINSLARLASQITVQCAALIKNQSCPSNPNATACARQENSTSIPNSCANGSNFPTVGFIYLETALRKTRVRGWLATWLWFLIVGVTRSPNMHARKIDAYYERNNNYHPKHREWIVDPLLILQTQGAVVSILL